MLDEKFQDAHQNLELWKTIKVYIGIFYQTVKMKI